jgi:radical SAM-linked protein
MDRQMAPHGVSFSLPSLRIDSFSLELAQKVKEIRKSGLTFAVEGGTQKLRDSINKNVTEEELVKVTRIAKDLGWKGVKLYFMIGLCSLTKGDEIREIEDLVMRLDSAVRGMQMTISVALFIPRPQTPFQWNAQMASGDALEDFNDMIRYFKKKKNINIRFNDPEMGELEGILCKGDRRLSKVIENAFRKGARFDGWGDKFNRGIWNSAFREEGIDPSFYLKEKEKDMVLPWDYINPGVTKKYLLKENEKALQGSSTGTCSDKCANYCGNCDFKKNKPVFAAKTFQGEIKPDKKFLSRIRLDGIPGFVCRILYSKTGNMKYIGPIDLEEVFERAFVRANIPVVYTRGFNPHIRIEMGWALPVGLSSLYEIAEIELSSKIPDKKFENILNGELPLGLRVIKSKINKMPCQKFTKICREHIVVFSFNLKADKKDLLKKAEGMGEYMKEGMKEEKMINLKEFFKSIEFSDSRVYIAFIQRQGGARIKDFINYFTGYDARMAMTLDLLVEKRIIISGEGEKGLFDIKTPRD